MAGFQALVLSSFFVLGCSSIDECEDIKSQARALVEEFAACDGGKACVVVDLEPLVENACIGDFQCFTALAEGSDLGEFSRRARALETEFAACRECAIAECGNSERWTAVCDEEERCRLRARE